MAEDPFDKFPKIADEVDEEGSATLREVAEHELECLWEDLADDERRARNGVWSMGCEATVWRIMRLTIALGKPAHWGSVPTRLLVNGWYVALHDAIGYDARLSDTDMAHVREVHDKYNNPDTFVL